MPNLIRIKAYIDFTGKKIFYTLYLFGFIKVNSGFIVLKKKYLVIHLTDKFALAINLNKLFSNGATKNPLRHIDCLSYKSALILNTENDVTKLVFAGIVNNINSFAYTLLKAYKPQTNFKGDVILVSQTDINGYLVDTSLVFNMISIIEIVIDLIIGGIKNNEKRKTR